MSSRDGEVTVVLAPALLALFPSSSSPVELEASSVRELIDALDVRWPGMGDRLRDTTPAVRRHINIFCDGVRGALDTRLPAGATVYVLTAVSGG